jgi:pyroglutamyl-peptidase
MKALVTGFEPFGDDPINPAREALPLLPRHLGGIEIATRVLPTVFGRSRDALDDALTAIRPDLVLCVGLAGGRAACAGRYGTCRKPPRHRAREVAARCISP